MIPPYTPAPDGAAYVPSLVAPNQILFVRAADGQNSPLSPRDLYFLQRLHIPLGQTWAIFGSHPPSAHFVQMGMLPPMAPVYTTVLISPQQTPSPPTFQQYPQAPPMPPKEDESFDPVAYEADVSGSSSVKDA